MNDVQHNDALAFSARVLGALFYFAPDSALAEPLVAAFHNGEWATQWPYPVEDADMLSAGLPLPAMNHSLRPGNVYLSARRHCRHRRGVPFGWIAKTSYLATPRWRCVNGCAITK